MQNYELTLRHEEESNDNEQEAASNARSDQTELEQSLIRMRWWRDQSIWKFDLVLAGFLFVCGIGCIVMAGAIMTCPDENAPQSGKMADTAFTLINLTGIGFIIYCATCIRDAKDHYFR